jgi:Transmembrane amino acid transporter protein
MLFSSLLLPAFAIFSLFCFMLLINTRKLIVGSYGDIGGALYGKHMRNIILASIVISQVGFVCAYTIFTAENLGAFVSAVTKGQHSMDVKFLILIQLVILLPCGTLSSYLVDCSFHSRYFKIERSRIGSRRFYFDGSLRVVLFRYIHIGYQGIGGYSFIQSERFRVVPWNCGICI